MREHVLALANRHLKGPFKPAGGANMLTRCPFHKGGEERKPSFSINLEKGLFHCFTCQVAGDIRYMLRLLGLPRTMIDSEVKIIQPILDRNKERLQLDKLNTFKNRDPFEADYTLPEAILGIYEWCPTQLVEKGFDPAILQDMEVGFDRRNERITYPLRDLYGNLAGFAGGATLEDQWPKYKVYQGGRKGVNGSWVVGDYGDWFDKDHPAYVCQNHDFLWNYQRVYPRTISAKTEEDSTVYIVEGYKACMWMIQHGYRNTVALMGSYISERQQQMLHRLGGPFVICLDNDKPGKYATYNVGRLLWKPSYGKLKVMWYPSEDDGTQPDDYNGEELKLMIERAQPFLTHMNNNQRSLKWQQVR